MTGSLLNKLLLLPPFSQNALTFRIQMSQKSEKVEISRLKVGFIAAVCLLTAGILYLFQGYNSENNIWIAGLMRVGVLCSALCLALPGKNQKAAWANVSPFVAWGLLIGLIILVRVPLRSFLILIPIVIAALVVGGLLRPKERKRPSNRPK